MRVGFIGLGAMGSPMAQHLAGKGLLQAVWNRTESRGRRVAADLGVRLAASPAELVNQCDAVLICVSADRDVLEVVEALLPAIKLSSIVVDCSTVSRDTALQVAGLIRNRGADFLDAPVTGGVEGAINASLVTMVGGFAATLSKVRPALEAYSRRIVHLGDVGAGQATKAVNQVMAAGINQAVTEALAFGEAMELDMDKVIDVVSGGAAGNWFLEKRGGSMTAGRFAPGFKLALHLKDLSICLNAAEQRGIPLPLAQQTLRDYQRLVEEGHGGEDISALYRLKKPTR